MMEMSESMVNIETSLNPRNE